MSGEYSEPWQNTSGIDSKRIAEIIVTRNDGKEYRGSGYRISATAVLTAGHIVSHARSVTVRFNADFQDEWVTEAAEVWSAPTADVAVLTIDPTTDDDIPPVKFGRINTADAELRYSAVGFPRFKLRETITWPADKRRSWWYRDSFHAVGTIAALSNRRGRSLEINVSPPERDPDPQHSPWEGMSGAAVWVSGRIVGLISEHHRSDGLGRLAATRVDAWYEQLEPNQLRRLCQITGLPIELDELPDVVPLATGLQPDLRMPKVKDWDPFQLKVHRSIASPHCQAASTTLPDMPTYIRRDIDQDIRERIWAASQNGGIILLIGSSCTGKTRSLYEAVLAELPGMAALSSW